jgi:hypothetical protein
VWLDPDTLAVVKAWKAQQNRERRQGGVAGPTPAADGLNHDP